MTGTAIPHWIDCDNRFGWKWKCQLTRVVDAARNSSASVEFISAGRTTDCYHAHD